MVKDVVVRVPIFSFFYYKKYHIFSVTVPLRLFRLAAHYFITGSYPSASGFDFLFPSEERILTNTKAALFALTSFIL